VARDHRSPRTDIPSLPPSLSPRSLVPPDGQRWAVKQVQPHPASGGEEPRDPRHLQGIERAPHPLGCRGVADPVRGSRRSWGVAGLPPRHHVAQNGHRAWQPRLPPTAGVGPDLPGLEWANHRDPLRGMVAVRARRRRRSCAPRGPCRRGVACRSVGGRRGDRGAVRPQVHEYDWCGEYRRDSCLGGHPLHSMRGGLRRRARYDFHTRTSSVQQAVALDARSISIRSTPVSPDDRLERPNADLESRSSSTVPCRRLKGTSNGVHGVLVLFESVRRSRPLPCASAGEWVDGC